eukprot:TRINITY_DN20313_c0_g1_i1.p1 TRINITY_DN20313_c0_g1~~TRINITY_DN20313_c0_g1_i1.p1  ORF type:complete len:1132 (+),score=183.74 TRINITY_DN20313_c0_g1_i1:61-3456(+)
MSSSPQKEKAKNTTSMFVKGTNRKNSSARHEDDRRNSQFESQEILDIDYDHVWQIEDNMNDKMLEKVQDATWMSDDTAREILNEGDEFQKQDFDPEVIMKKINDQNGILRDQQGSNHSGMGPWWSTESEEVKYFRKMMEKSAAEDESVWKEANPSKTIEDAMASKMLPHYLASGLRPEQQSRFTTLRLVVTAPNSKKPLELEVDKNTAADTAIDQCRSHFGLEGENRTTRLVLKVAGRKDYMWGNSFLINFAHIRKCALSNLVAKLKITRVTKEEVDQTNKINYKYISQQAEGAGVCCMESSTPTHSELSVDSPAAHLLRELSLWDINSDVELTINSLSSITFVQDKKDTEREIKEGDDVWVCVVGQIFHGTTQLADPQRTPWRVLRDIVPHNMTNESQPMMYNTVWGAPHGTLRFRIKYANLPRDARLCLTAVVCWDASARVMDEEASKLIDDAIASAQLARRGFKKLALNFGAQLTGTDDEERYPLFYLGWVNLQLFDHRGYLRTGTAPYRMWVKNEKANPISVVSTCNSKKDVTKQLTIAIHHPVFSKPVRFPSGKVPSTMTERLHDNHNQLMNELDSSLRKNIVNQLRTVREVVQKDPLYKLTAVDKLLLWQFRGDLTQNPSALSKFLQAVDWASPAAVQGALHLLHHPDKHRQWQTPPPGEELVALELLDARYASSAVREYAINILDRLGDDLLSDCILQLVQVLKYEPYHYSALARFLLRRCIRSPHQIGHQVFWHLKAEMSNSAVQERHGLILEEYLKRVPVLIRRGLAKEVALIDKLFQIAVSIKDKSIKEKDRNSKVRQALETSIHNLIKEGSTFTLPLNPRMDCKGIAVEKCKVMDSKKLPIWLVFHNADPHEDPIFVIFKAGDDLRQDLLTLQVIAMMDSFWKGQGLDLHMSPYGCVACEDGVGMIEVVLNSETIANITKKQGGAAEAFHDRAMLGWLRQQPCNKTPDGVKTCMYNFLYSCAGYCVATYILGIGDRHNDNIMMKKDGTLFHIDFGHFLGNFKSKFGIKRETSPFIFTPMYAGVFGGEKTPVFRHFVKVACHAYNIVRRSSHIIISLFALMLSTGIPELQKTEDIEWLYRVLLIDEQDDDYCAKRYEEQVKDSLSNKKAQINDYIHIRAHS